MSGEPACTLAGFADITEEIAGHGRGVDYSIAQVERLSAFFIMLIGFEWVRPRLAPGTRATFELRHYSIFPQRLAAQRIPDPRATGGGSARLDSFRPFPTTSILSLCRRHFCGVFHLLRSGGFWYVLATGCRPIRGPGSRADERPSNPPEEHDVRRNRLWSAALVGLALSTTTAAAQTTTLRDASGRMTGTVTTDSNGQQTFRDGAGRMTGTATTDANGTTTFRDASGRTTGTATDRRTR
jgi:hypothetical protein